MRKLGGLLALFAAGLLLAGGLAAAVGAADVTTTETLAVTTTVEETTTAPVETVETTVEQTTTVAPTNPTTTATSSSSSSSTPTWVWIVIGILAATGIGLLIALFARRGGISDEERQRRLDAAVATWTTQGWALESQTPGSTILRRGPELMVVSIDDHGQISTRPLANS
jgi:hypothetical protein